MTTDDEADLHLSTAHDLLRDAEDVRAIGKYSAAVSMSYYAVFHAAKSILIHLGEETSTHQGTSARFHYRAVYRSDFPPETARLLGKLRIEREDADNEVHLGQKWDDPAATEAIGEATRFVFEVDAWFERRRGDAD